MPPKSKNKKETSKISLGPLTQSFNKVRAGQQALRKDTAQASRLWSFRRDDVRQGGTTGKPAMDWLLQAFESTSVPQLVRSDAVGALDALAKAVKSHQGELIAVAMIVNTHSSDPSVMEMNGYCAACGRISGPLEFPTPDGISAMLAVPVTDLYLDQSNIDQDIAVLAGGESFRGIVHLNSKLLLGEGDWTTGRQYQREVIAIIGQAAIKQWVKQDHDGHYMGAITDLFAHWADQTT